MKTGLQEFFNQLRFSIKTALFAQSTCIKFKKARAAVVVVFALLSVNVGWGQTITETFNEVTTTATTGGTGMPSSYSTGSYLLSSGTWVFTAAIRGTTNVNSNPGCQIQSATGNNIISPTIATGGVGVISFYAAGTSAGAAVNVSISINGAAFTAGTSFTSLTTTSTLKTVTINDASANIRIKFTRTAGTLTLDDISTTLYTSTPSLAVTGTLAHASSCINTAATKKTYTITNTGTAASSVVVSSSDAQFVVSNLSSTSIAATSGTATYDVTFTPTSSGAKSATITVSYNTSTSATTSSLTGTGTASVTQAVTSSSATSITAKLATLNGNYITLGVCPATIEKGFVYSLTSTNNNPLVGGTGVTKSTVTLGSTGAYTLALTGLASSSGYSYKAYVYDGTTYTYSAPIITFTTLDALSISGTLSNGTVCPNVPASAVTYTVTNNGATSVSAVSVASSDAQFVVSSMSSSIIAAAGTATYTVTFTPSSSGSKSAIVTVSGTSITSVANTPTGVGTTPVTQAVTTSAATLVVNTTATLNGNYSTAGVCPATSGKGFVYAIKSTNADPLVSGTGVTQSTVTLGSTGTYLKALTGLTPATTYTYKAYVYNGTTYTYGTATDFTTLTVATKLGFGTTPPAVGSISTNLTAFTVQALRSDNTLDTEFSGSITVAKASGPGNISGTLTVSASSGVATFSSVQFDALGDYTIIASSGALTTVTSSSFSIFAYAIQDYRTIASGNWGTNTIWEKWNGSAWAACLSGDYPDVSTASVTIQNGHTVDNDGSGLPPWDVNNLTVDAGGKLWDNAFNGGNSYIQLYGDIVCNGTIGTPNGDDISFDIAGGNDCSISGTGSFTATRIRKDESINASTDAYLSIEMDIRLTWSSSSGSVMYNDGTPSNFYVTINVGKTVRGSGPGSALANITIDGNNFSAPDPTNSGGTFTVNGTLDIDGVLHAYTNNSARPCSIIINNGGAVKCRYVRTGSSGIAGNTLRIFSGGKLTIFGSVDTISATLVDTTWRNFSTTNNTWDFQSGSTIEYSGATQQKVNGITSCSNFTVSGGGLKKLGNDFTVAGMLTLTSGRVQTDAYKLIHTSTSAADLTHTTGSSSFIFGTYRRYIASNSSTYELPVGLSSATSGYRRADILNNNLSGVTYIDASVRSITETANNMDSRLSTTEGGTSLTDVLGASVWSLIPNAQPSSGTYGVKLFVANSGMSSADDNTFCPVKRNTGSSDYADWATFFASTTIPSSGASGRMYDSGNGYAQRLGYTSFSEHAIGKTTFVVLPVSLISFDAKKQGQNNVVFWSTITEENCDYYTLEKTLDGTSYEIVGKMKGGGNSLSLLEYSLVDYDVRKTINYYRLKQTDTDGAEKISALVSVDNRENTGKVVVKTLNILGQEIDENYKGLVIVLFEDGTSIKKVQ